MEPITGSYIFTLDPTVSMQSLDEKPIELENYAWRKSATSNRSQKFFAMASWMTEDTLAPHAQDLQVPPLPEKTRAWVQEQKSKTSDLTARRRALRQLFESANLTYTLKPGNYSMDKGLDEFLFERRRGFCEHFAGSYATLARALGIPARVVSGYQGAEYNAVAQFWRVTQRNAHAWTEVWTGSSWLRVDPALWAATSEFSRGREKSWAEMIDDGLNMYEALNYRWTNFLIDFDQKSQALTLKEALPQIFFAGVSILALFFLVRLLRNWFHSPKNRAHHRRQSQLSLLVQEIKSTAEEVTNQDLSHLPPLQILAHAPKHLFGPAIFYAQVASLYERVFYQENIDDSSMALQLHDLQRKWVEIQVLQK
jgi:hypothetical protein